MLQLSFVRFKKGTYLFVEGKADQGFFYIIQNGYVDCHSQDSVPGAPTRFGPGDFVGVISCMSNHAHVESVIAATDVVAILVRKEQYSDLIAQNTPVAMKIIRSFAGRMRVLNEQMMRQTMKSSAVPSPEQIFSVANCYEKLGKLDIATYAYYHYLKACPKGMYFPEAKARFIALKPHSHAVYFEPTADLVREYPRDTMIFSEFQSGADMFIIQAGQVKISKVVNGNEVTLALLKKGDMFGEMALLENMPRSASAIANEPCQLMTVNHQNFDKMVATQPQLISRLTNTFAERIWSMYRQLANTQLTDPLQKLFDMLALQMEKNRAVIASRVAHHTDLTPQDLATMCGLTKEQQSKSLYDFVKSKLISVEAPSNKIIIRDTGELAKEVQFNRNTLRRLREHEEHLNR